jgi:trimeric autotransporter adhesin
MRMPMKIAAVAATALLLCACDDGTDTGPLEDEIADLRDQIEALETTVADMAATIIELRAALNQVSSDVAVLEEESGGGGAALAQRVSDLEAWTEDALTMFAFVEDLEAVEARVATAEDAIDGLDGRVAVLETRTAALSAEAVDGRPALVIAGVNVFVRNGEGATGTENGLGNLVIGYDEIRSDVGGDPEEMDRSGSHNLVVGQGHDYASHGGLVAGQYNALEAPFAVVAGGYRNRVTGASGAVTGGVNNEASGEASSVTGGSGNEAEALASSVSGGLNRTMSGSYGWRAGGLEESN